MVISVRKTKYLLIPAALLLLLLPITRLEPEESPAFSLQSPAENHTLVIDAGHGGVDGGAVSGSGVYESDINLEIALKLEAVMGLFGVSPVMTRAEKDIDYPETATTIREKKVWEQKNRVSRINSIDNAVLISIHQNKFDSSSVHGAQVMYADTEDSEAFAELTQDIFVSRIDSTNRRKAVGIPDSVYLMKNISCPAILIECGFLSNPTELALLQTEGYQIKIAAGIASAYMSYIRAGAGL